MWISSRKRKTPSESQARERLNKIVGSDVNEKGSTTDTSAKDSSDDWKSTLPLDWTRMNRDCLDSINCAGCRRHVRREGQVLQGGNVLQGRAIVCLHDLEAKWWQGYFVPQGSSKPYRLLAVQEEIDDCLECADGGYRKVTLTVYTNNDKPHKIKGVDWTGGDMMNLYHPDAVELNAEQLVTGDKAVVVAQQYFAKLVRQLQEQCSTTGKDEESNVLGLLPDLAIVKGTMSLKLPGDSD